MSAGGELSKYLRKHGMVADAAFAASCRADR